MSESGVDFISSIINKELYNPPRLFISFSGADQLSFQFGHTFRKYLRSHILMRDRTQRYHHDGVLGIGNQADVIRYIRSFKNRFLITTTGVSSGGYPALLYGQLAEVDEVIVFGALTGRQADDFPPEDRHEIVDPKHPDIDLRRYFTNGPIPRVRSFISDGDGTRLDGQMSRRIGIEPIVIPGYSHSDLARGMRDAGMFEELFGK